MIRLIGLLGIALALAGCDGAILPPGLPATAGPVPEIGTGPIRVSADNGATVTITQSLGAGPDAIEAVTAADAGDPPVSEPGPTPTEAMGKCYPEYLEGWHEGYVDGVAGPDCQAGQCPLLP